MTRPKAEIALGEWLLGQVPRQGALAPELAPAPVVKTGKRGRPKGRPNNKTLAARLDLDKMGEALLRERFRSGMVDPVDEARAWIRKIWNIPEDAPMHYVIRRDANGFEVIFADAVLELAKELVKIKEKAADVALPFVQRKMPAQVDINERRHTTLEVVLTDARQRPPAPEARVLDLEPEKAAPGAGEE